MFSAHDDSDNHGEQMTMQILSTQMREESGALLCLALSMLLSSLGTSIANIALPTFLIAFDVGFDQVKWVVTIYLGTLSLFAVCVGRLGDLFGHKRMLMLGLALFTGASALCALAPGLWTLVAARSLQGIGAAFLMTLTIALVRETVSNNRVGRAMGLLGTMSAIGTALGPVLGGLLIDHFGWPSIFVVLVPMGLLAMFLAHRILSGDVPARAPSLSKFATLRHTAAVSGLLANLVVANMMMATLLVGPFYLGFSLGLSVAMIGLVMSVGPVISICAGVPSGQIVDKWGASRVRLVGLLALAFGAMVLACFPQLFGVRGYIAAIAILTPGYQLFQSANNTMLMAGVPTDQRGVVSGLLSLSRNLGLISGAVLMGAVFSFGVGTSDLAAASAESIVDGMQLTFLTTAVSIVAVIWMIGLANEPNMSTLD